MEQKTNKKKTLTKLYILAVLAILCLVYFLVPSVNAYVNQVASVLGSANVDTVVAFIRSYGAYAMAFSFALMVFQSAIAPLPAFLITFANAAIFGWWQGAILSWTSSMAGAALASVEGYFEKYGSRTILVCRLLPFVSFDAISYFAGLTPIKFWPFFIATGVGQLPATIIYSYVGGMLTGGVKYFVTALLCIFSLGILVMIVRRIYMERQEKKKQAMEAAQPEAHE